MALSERQSGVRSDGHLVRIRQLAHVVSARPAALGQSHVQTPHASASLSRLCLSRLSCPLFSFLVIIPIKQSIYTLYALSWSVLSN